MDIIIFIFLCYQNYIRAKRIGQNPIKWVLYTLGALFLGMMLGTMVVYILLYKKQLLSVDDYNAFAQFCTQPYRMLLIYAIGFGGYLWIRARLEKLMQAAASPHHEEEEA
jgi:RsiW-degrading membrane proteinase PrsW (M82 family)